MKTESSRRRRIRPRGAFTLIELLIVILIIGIVSAATIAVVVPAYKHRGVPQAALLVQATISGARDAAVRANAPRGFRLIPDSLFNGVDGRLAASRLIPIEPAPDYAMGKVSFDRFTTSTFLGVPTPGPARVLPGDQATATSLTYNTASLPGDPRLRMIGEVTSDFTTGIPGTPTQFYWNIRQGEKFRFSDSGRNLVIAGPMLTLNPERFLNMDVGATRYVTLPPGATPPSGTTNGPEFLFLVNGQDDDGDGYVDNSFDGIDNDGDGLIDPGFNGIDDDGINGVDDYAELFLRKKTDGTLFYDTRTFENRFALSGYNPEYEQETAPSIGRIDFTSGSFVNQPYSIQRRAVPTPGAREVLLPSTTVIDLTSWNASAFTIAGSGTTPNQYFFPERSRLPVDPYSHYVDVMIAPNGSVVRMGEASSNAESAQFYHFWIAERDDVFIPIATKGVLYLLPMPKETFGFPNSGDTSGRFLQGDRRLVTLTSRTGQVVTNSVESTNFDAVFDTTTTPAHFGIETPYLAPQLGVKEAP